MATTATLTPSTATSTSTAAPTSMTARDAGRPSSASWRGVGLAALACALAYAPNLQELATLWVREPNYSHGILVPAIAAWLLWRRRSLLARAERSQSEGWVWGLLGLAAVLAVRAWLFARNETWFENLTLLPALAMAWIAVAGWKSLRWSWPGLLFLLFMFPLPGRVDGWLAMPLQRLATVASGQWLHAMGINALIEGNVLTVAGHKLEVARACNGLSMMLTLTCVTATVVVLLELRLWQRIVLLASAVPVALFCNILRITATGVSCVIFKDNPEIIDTYAHDWAGYAMMPVGFGLVLLEAKLLSRLVVEVDDDVEERLKASVRGFGASSMSHAPSPIAFPPRSPNAGSSAGSGPEGSR